MNIFLSLQNTYEAVEIALFNKDMLICMTSIKTFDASKTILSSLDLFLKKNNYTLSDISFIAVNQGPGPFAALRTVLTTANAISFARNIPLIGIDGLSAFFEQEKSTAYPHTIILLNAFNKDVYFCYQASAAGNIQTGYKKIGVLLDTIATELPAKTIRFIGNAAEMYRDEIQHLFGSYAIIANPLPLTCSIQTIGAIAWQKWLNKKEGAKQLKPLYLKKHAVELG